MDALKILGTTRGLEMGTSYMKFSSLAHWAIRSLGYAYWEYPEYLTAGVTDLSRDTSIARYVLNFNF